MEQDHELEDLRYRINQRLTSFSNKDYNDYSNIIGRIFYNQLRSNNQNDNK